MGLIIFAGTPPTTVNGATSAVTTAPAATTAPRPIVTPGNTIAPAPDPDIVFDDDRCVCRDAPTGRCDRMLARRDRHVRGDQDAAADADAAIGANVREFTDVDAIAELELFRRVDYDRHTQADLQSGASALRKEPCGVVRVGCPA